jgi:flagellar biosynthesis regulator FlaF
MLANTAYTNTHINTQPDINSTLETFFDQYDLEECQKEIWNLLIAYFGQSDNDLPNELSRSNTVFFCANIDALLKGLHKAWEVKNG